MWLVAVALDSTHSGYFHSQKVLLCNVAPISHKIWILGSA